MHPHTFLDRQVVRTARDSFCSGHSAVSTRLHIFLAQQAAKMTVHSHIEECLGRMGGISGYRCDFEAYWSAFVARNGGPRDEKRCSPS